MVIDTVSRIVSPWVPSKSKPLTLVWPPSGEQQPLSPDEAEERQRTLNETAIRHGIPANGQRTTSVYGMQWVVDGHVYAPDLFSFDREFDRDKGAGICEDPRDLLPVVFPENTSQRLLDFFLETSLCTSKSLMPLDTLPHLRPHTAYPDGQSVDHFSNPGSITFFLDIAHIDEAIFAHEIGHVWIDVVEDCEDYRIIRDISDTSRARQMMYLQSFVLDIRVNEVLRERGFDLSVIEAHQSEVMSNMAMAVAMGHRPPYIREAALDAMLIADSLLQREMDSTTIERPNSMILDPLKVIQQELPEVYGLARKLADSVLRHGYSTRQQVRNAVDECWKHAFEFTGDLLDLEVDVLEWAPLDAYQDKFPDYLPGLPVKAKLEIGKAMAKQKAGIYARPCIEYLTTGHAQVRFIHSDGRSTPPTLLEHMPRRPPVLPPPHHEFDIANQLSRRGPWQSPTAPSPRPAPFHLPQIPKPMIPQPPQLGIPNPQHFGMAQPSQFGIPEPSQFGIPPQTGMPQAPFAPVPPHPMPNPGAPAAISQPPLPWAHGQVQQGHAAHLPPGVRNPSHPAYSRRRNYMAGLGRWLSRARLKEQLELREHPYTYVQNNPLRYVDPTGRVKVEINARSVTDPTGLTDTRLWGDHTFILIWDTDKNGNVTPGQTPYILAGYNHDPAGKADGYLYAYAGRLNSWYDDFNYLSGKYHDPYFYRGVIWSMTDPCKSASQVYSALRHIADIINARHPHYNFAGITAPNSNSAVATMINKGLGFNITAHDVSDPMTVPGFNDDATNFQPPQPPRLPSGQSGWHLFDPLFGM